MKKESMLPGPVSDNLSFLLDLRCVICGGIKRKQLSVSDKELELVSNSTTTQNDTFM
jgi:hypothetical protein